MVDEEFGADGGASPSDALLLIARLFDDGNERDLVGLLGRAATIIARGLGFGTVSIHVYRPAWDDFELVAAFGDASTRTALVGSSTSRSEMERLLDERGRYREVYSVECAALGSDAQRNETFGPAAATGSKGGNRSGRRQESFLVPMLDRESSLLGVVSVAEPSGDVRPSDREIDLLAALVGRVSSAIAAAQHQTDADAQLRTLEQLMRTSSKLQPGLSPKASLQLVCAGIREALGFDKVAVCLIEDGVVRTAASEGWDASAIPTLKLTLDQVERLLDPRYEQFGCHLLGQAETLATVGPGVMPSYVSELNGVGPHAWQRHWLVVPLRGAAGALLGFVWVDDPLDRLIPGRERLQALRLFADQVTTTLEFAAQLEQIAALHDARRALIESAPIGIFELGPDRTVRSWNAAAERIFGWSAAEVVGERNPIVPAGEWEEHLARTERTLTEGTTIDTARKRRRKDGEEIDVQLQVAPIHDPGGTVTGMVAMVEDVSDRLRALEALRRSEELSRRILENSTDLITLIGLDGRVLFNSPSFERILGKAADAQDGQPFGMLVHEDDLATALAAVAAALRGERLPQPNSLRVRHADGGWRILEGLPSLIRNEQGEPELILSVLRDVTDQRALEVQSQQAQRVEAIGRLTGGIAHDFNNLLTAIRGYAEIALSHLADREQEAADAIGETIRAADRAAALTHQLLAFSRQQVLIPTPLDLNRAVRGLHDLLTRLLGEQIDVRLELASDVALVLADATQVEQVIINLAINARDAMPNGGPLTITTARIELDENWCAHHPGSTTGSYIVLTIRDEGTGMPDEVKARAFEPFFTTKPVGEGTGLGLATVYGIVKQSNGYIDLTSETGQGTAVKIYLPPLDSNEEAKPQASTRSTANGSERILLVEDNASVRAVTAEQLRQLGYIVTEAGTPTAALELELANLDLLICDVLLPEMNGRELVTLLHHKRNDLRVLFISGYAPTGTITGDHPFLQKPFSQTTLAQAVQEALTGPLPR